MRNRDGKVLVATFSDAKALARMAWIIRAARMGRVRRRGQRGHRIYDIAPRNMAEMPYATRKVFRDAHS
jgi:hypothetical protein